MRRFQSFERRTNRTSITRDEPMKLLIEKDNGELIEVADDLEDAFRKQTDDEIEDLSRVDIRATDIVQDIASILWANGVDVDTEQLVDMNVA